MSARALHYTARRDVGGGSMRHLVLAVVVIGGCAGEVPPGGGNTSDTAPDAGGGGGGGGSGVDAGAASDAAGFACRNKVASVGSGHHNPGQDCQGACHNHGFTLGGTIYAAANSTTSLSGATITVTDATGKSFDVVSQANGNFYTSQAIKFPVTVTASACPSVAPMVAQVTATMDGCNQSGCHVTGAQGRIHLP
jgi:hypothetical protein